MNHCRQERIGEKIRTYSKHYISGDHHVPGCTMRKNGRIRVKGRGTKGLSSRGPFLGKLQEYTYVLASMSLLVRSPLERSQPFPLDSRLRSRHRHRFSPYRWTHQIMRLMLFPGCIPSRHTYVHSWSFPRKDPRLNRPFVPRHLTRTRPFFLILLRVCANFFTCFFLTAVVHDDKETTS